MEDTITRKEHEEFARRMDAENARLGKRVSLLEDNVRQMYQLSAWQSIWKICWPSKKSLVNEWNP